MRHCFGFYACKKEFVLWLTESSSGIKFTVERLMAGILQKVKKRPEKYTV